MRKRIVLLFALGFTGLTSAAPEIISRAPGLASDCRTITGGVTLGTCPIGAVYSVGGLFESLSYSPLGINVSPDGDSFIVDFVQTQTSPPRYRVQWAVNTVNRPQYVGRIFFTGLNEPINKIITKDIRTTLQLKLIGKSKQTGSQSRITVGAGAVWNGQTNWVEINLDGSDTWDKCTPTANTGGVAPVPCDDTRDIYDRRSDFGSGEIVEYDGRAINKVMPWAIQALPAGGSAIIYTFDWLALFKAYPWTRPPTSWDGVSLAGVYVGHESMVPTTGGGVWTYFQVEGMTTFSNN